MVAIFWHNPCTAVLQASTAVHQSITTHSASNRQLSSWIIRTIVVQTREICCGRQITRRQWADEEALVIVMQHFLNQRFAPVLQKGLSTVKMLGSSQTIPLRFLDQLELNFQFHLIVCSVFFSSVFSVPVLIECLEIGPFSSQSNLNGSLPEIFRFSASKCFNQYALKCKLDYGKQAVRWEEKLRG